MRVLTVNTGSSSVKVGVYRVAADSAEPVAGLARAIETGAAAAGPAQAAALTAYLGWLDGQGEAGRVAAAGHRLVVGSREFLAPRRLTAAAIARLAELTPLAPDHLPQAVAAVAAVTHWRPQLPQACCSDSSFHAGLSAAARTTAVPRLWRERGVERWGFHGLSCESALAALARADPAAARGRVIVAHLGNGCSLTAIRAGTSIDTTMGMTPAGGLLMSHRSGDLDPGILVHMAAAGLDAATLNRLVNRESGLAGISEGGGDMRALLARRGTDRAAALAIDCFVWQARKFVAAMAASLGGLETLVFTGGIGENASEIRAAICAGLAWMGLELDPARNEAHAAVISPPGTAVLVRIVAADEDRQIALHAAAALATETQE